MEACRPSIAPLQNLTTDDNGKVERPEFDQGDKGKEKQLDFDPDSKGKEEQTGFDHDKGKGEQLEFDSADIGKKEEQPGFEADDNGKGEESEIGPDGNGKEKHPDFVPDDTEKEGQRDFRSAGNGKEQQTHKTGQTLMYASQASEQITEIIDQNLYGESEIATSNIANQNFKNVGQNYEESIKFSSLHALDQSMKAVNRHSDNSSESVYKAGELPEDLTEEYTCQVENNDPKYRSYHTFLQQNRDVNMFETDSKIHIQGDIGSSPVKLTVKAKRKKMEVFEGTKLAQGNMDYYMMILESTKKQARLLPVTDRFELKEDYSKKKKYVNSAARAERAFKRHNEETPGPASCRKDDAALHLGDIESSEESEEEEEIDAKDLTNFMPSPPKRNKAEHEVERLYELCLSVICKESLPHLEKYLDEMPKSICEHVLENLTPKKFSKFESKCLREEDRQRNWERHCEGFKNCAKNSNESYRDYFMRTVKFFQREYRKKLTRGYSKKQGIKKNYRIMEESNEENDETDIFETIYQRTGSFIEKRLAQESMKSSDNVPGLDSSEEFESDAEKEIDYPESSQ